MEKYSFAISALLFALSILTFLLTHSYHAKSKMKIKKMEEDKLAELKQKEQESEKRISENERTSAERIRLDEQASLKRKRELEEKLSERENDLNKRISQFNKEQAVRENYNKKSDREVVVDLHVKAMRLLSRLDVMEQSLSQNYDKVLTLTENMNSQIEDLNESVESSMEELPELIENSVYNIGQNLESTVMNMNDLDKDDVEDAVSNALSNSWGLRYMIEGIVEDKLSSLKYDLESTVSDALQNNMNNL